MDGSSFFYNLSDPSVCMDRKTPVSDKPDFEMGVPLYTSDKRIAFIFCDYYEYCKFISNSRLI
jgi:hypothetical protein